MIDANTVKDRTKDECAKIQRELWAIKFMSRFTTWQPKLTQIGFLKVPLSPKRLFTCVIISFNACDGLINDYWKNVP
jgi:hypothetical protein